MPTTSKRTHDETNREILAALDVLAEYRGLGVDITGTQPNAGGWVACRAVGREDRVPSAAVNIRSGYYTDLGGNGRTLSLWDFAAAHGSYTDWREARRSFAAKAGVILGRGRPTKDPSSEIVLQPWVDSLAALWCLTKPPVSVDALQAAGGILARYPAKSQAHPVVAVPVYGPRLIEEPPCGWVVWHAGGRELPVYGKQGEVVRRVKMKTVAGSQSGLMGRHALARLSIDPTPKVIWKVEGPTDLMALWQIIPSEQRDRHLVVCNSGGSTENIRPEIAEVFAGHVVYVLHDADKPGEIGAAKWCEALVNAAAGVRQVRLPFEVVVSHGKDFRDWANEGHTYLDLLTLAESSPVFAGARAGIVARPFPGAPLAANGPDTTQGTEAQAAGGLHAGDNGEASQRLIVDALSLDVLGERESGNVVVFAFHPTRRRTVEIRDPDKLTYARLLQIAGPPVADVVTETGEEGYNRLTVSACRNAICYLGGRRRLDNQALAGAGCWQAIDETTGALAPQVILVGAGEAAVWDGATATLGRVAHPRAGGRLLNLSESDPWFDHDALVADIIRAADPDWCGESIEDCMKLWDRWRWRDLSGAPLIMTGLVLATWIQTLWEWRPQVAVTGESKTGKSTLFETLDGIFGGLAVRSSKSSAAGIRQRVRHSARVVLVDEFESSKRQAEVLEMARASSRGDEIHLGTPNQRGAIYLLRHLFWVAMISLNLKRAPDRNRWIELELLLPHKGNEGKLSTPPTAQLADLGRRLLAIAVRHGIAAGPLASRLKAARVEGVDSRLVESYAVPVSVWATAVGLDDAGAEGLLRQMLRGVKQEADESEAISDPKALLQAIGRACIWVNKEQITISEALVKGGIDNEAALARHGIALAYDSTNPKRGETSMDMAEFLFVDPDAAEGLLVKTSWEGQNIGAHLGRLSGARKGRRRIAGRRATGVLIPADEIDDIKSADEF